MKKTLLLLLLACMLSTACKPKHKTGYGLPLVVLTETNPWQMVIGGDAPTIAIYENGQVIYKLLMYDTVAYNKVMLSHEDLLQTINDLGITDSLKRLPKFINVAHGTDQPVAELRLNLDSPKIINIAGHLRWGADRANTPTYFLTVYDKLIKYRHGRATEWLPDSIEVMLSDYSNSPEKPLTWPANWPDLKNKSTVKRSDDLYSVYVDKKHFANITKLISSLTEKQAVLVNGKKFSVSYRFPFPNLK